MSKKQIETPEPLLSPADKWRSLKHISMLGGGLADDLEARCIDRGIEIDRFNSNADTMIRDRDMETLLGDQAEVIRQDLDADDCIPADSAAATLRVDALAVPGLAARRGIPTAPAANETLFHRKAVENLQQLLANERAEYDGRGLREDLFPWTIMNLQPRTALINALPEFKWQDPFYLPKPVREPSVIEKAYGAIMGPERPSRQPTVKFDDDEEMRAYADRIGVRYDVAVGAKLRGGRTAFLVYDLMRLTGFNPLEDDISGMWKAREHTQVELFRIATRCAYVSIFPESEFNRESLRAELMARYGARETVAV